MIKIYGERNTNTNYISKLIELNLDVKQISGVVPQYVMKLQKVLPGKELVRDLYFQFTFNKNLGWKHSLVRPVINIRNCDLAAQNLNFITITKNPYSWLLSLHRNTYHQYYKKKPDFETFLTSPWKTVRRDNYAEKINSPIELWNIKNSSYLQLSALNCVHITTESIFSAPDKVIDNISTSFSIKKLAPTFINFEKSTKDSKKDSTYYQNYYLNERWRKNLSRESVSIINRQVDKSLMNHFGYKVL